MPRQQTTEPHRNKDGYYRESFWYNGKKYSIRSKTLRGLYEKVAERKRALEAGEIVCNHNTLVRFWAQEWLITYKKSTCGAAQYETYTGLIANHISITLFPVYLMVLLILMIVMYELLTKKTVH